MRYKRKQLERDRRPTNTNTITGCFVNLHILYAR